jgi:hypothetical protein
MSRIKIVSAPELPGIHNKILEGWIGVELEAKGPYRHRGTHVYEVPRSIALEALKKNNEMSWRWFFWTPMRIPVFLFPAECCEEIPSDESAFWKLMKDF